jgi:hypothetical protein
MTFQALQRILRVAKQSLGRVTADLKREGFNE